MIAQASSIFFPLGVCDRFITFQIRIETRSLPLPVTLHSSFRSFRSRLIDYLFILYLARRFLLKARAFALEIFQDVASREFRERRDYFVYRARVEKLRVDFRVGTIGINCASETILNGREEDQDSQGLADLQKSRPKNKIPRT